MSLGFMKRGLAGDPLLFWESLGRKAPEIFKGCLLFLLVLNTTACRQISTTQPLESLARFEFNEPQMGVPFRIVTYAPDLAAASQAAQRAFTRISQLNDIMSDYDTDSEINRLSRRSGRGRAVPVSWDLWHVLRRARSLAERSGGAFDVTVGPYVGLWRKARREHVLPEPRLLAEARTRVGWEKLILHAADRSVELAEPVMHLDLGGIAKGYAVDEGLEVLQRHGLNRSLVAGGGDIAVGAPPPGERGWRVKLDAAAATDAQEGSATLWLCNEAVATSGDMFQFVELGGARYSHIVDPRTGLGLTNQSLVTVVAPDGITADGLATTVSVLGPGDGLEFLRQFPGAEARVSWRVNGQVRHAATPGFSKRLRGAP